MGKGEGVGAGWVVIAAIAGARRLERTTKESTRQTEHSHTKHRHITVLNPAFRHRLAVSINAFMQHGIERVGVPGHERLKATQESTRYAPGGAKPAPTAPLAAQPRRVQGALQ